MPQALGRLFLLLLLIWLAGCEPRQPEQPAGAERPAAAVDPDARVYRVVPGESWLRILAYKEGALSAIGHNHVISTTAVTGQLRYGSTPGRSAVELSFPVDSLEVDRPELREAEGEDFPGTLEQSAIDGTRANMLGEKQLDAARYPSISLRSRRIEGELPELRLWMDVRVRDQEQLVEFPVTVQRSGDQLIAEGLATVSQTALGMEPFSVALGALSVRDELKLRFRIVAQAEN